MADIKKVIKDFVSFDIQNNYYQKEMKEDVVRMFKKILFEDDVTVRKFLQDFFKKTEELANDYSLIASDEEAESTEAEDETEESDEDETEVTDDETTGEEENTEETGEEVQSGEDETETTEEQPVEDEEEKKTVVAPESKEEDKSKMIFERYTEQASDYLE